MQNKKINYLVNSSIAIAIVAFFTMFFRVPVLGGRMYFHLGEVIILLVAIKYGKIQGAWAGALGSAIADVLVGAAIWAPISFVLRGFEGYMVGYLLYNKSQVKWFDFLFIAIIISVVIVGYTVATYYLYGNAAAIAELSGDTIQGVLGIILVFFILKIMPNRL